MTKAFKPTDEQATVITFDGSAFVTACPGAGKTRVLIERARHLLDRKGWKCGIAFLSFTEVAVSELEVRLRREGLLPSPAMPHFIGTFDSFLWRVLVAPFGIPGSLARPRLIPDLELREVKPFDKARPIPLKCFDRETGEAKCTQPFPFALDDPELRVHLVAICRNSIDPARTYFAKFTEKGAPDSTGSLAFSAVMREEQMLANPFWVGDIDPSKTFVHVFDEGSLDLLLTELDAGPDFIDYLVERERAIRKEHLSVIYGEEDFLAVYFSNLQPNGFGAYRPYRPIPANVDDFLLTLEESMWSALRNSGIYALFEGQRKAAMAWKRITNDLSEAVLSANVGREVSTESLATHERAVRVMASENRASRAALGHVLIEKFNTVPDQARSARVVASLTHPERIYILLLFPWIDAHVTYDGYRAERKACMELYARAAQVKFPAYAEIVVLGADTKGSPGSSETVMVAEGNPNLSEAEKAETLAMMEEHQILSTLGDSASISYRPSMPDPRIFDSFWAVIPPDKLPGVNAPCYCGSGRKFKKCCRP